MKKIVKIFWRFVYLAIFIAIAFIAGKFFWFDGFINKKEEQIVKNKYDYELELRIPYSDFYTQKINSDIDGRITEILYNLNIPYNKTQTTKLFENVEEAIEISEVDIIETIIRKKSLPDNFGNYESSFFEYYLQNPEYTYYFSENLGPIKKFIKNIKIEENEGKISFQLNDFFVRKTYNYYESLLYKSVESNLKHLGIKSFYISELRDYYKVLFSSKDIDNYDVDFTLDTIPEKLKCHTFDKTYGCKKEYFLEIHKVLPRKVGQAKAFGLNYNEQIVYLDGSPFLIDTNKVCINHRYSDFRRAPEYWRNNVFSQLLFSKTAFAGDVYILEDKICIFNGFVKVEASHKVNSWNEFGDHYIRDIPMDSIEIDEQAWRLIKEDCFGGKKYLEENERRWKDKKEKVNQWWVHNCFGKYLITLDDLTPIAYFKVAEPYGEEEMMRDVLASFPHKGVSSFAKLDIKQIKNIDEKIFENDVNTISLPYYEVFLRKTNDKSFTNSLRGLIAKEKEYDDYARPFGGDKLKLLDYYIRVLFSNNT